MLRFVELAVEARKARVLREVLHFFKNITQNTAVSGVEAVVRRLITLAEARVSVAQAAAEIAAGTVAEARTTVSAVETQISGAEDDLDAVETPESLLLSTVSAEGDRERADRQTVTPWLKFLWEAYRIALDILRNNVRMELLYQTVANQAFAFCLRHARKIEFRRLCDLLRQHLATAAKYAHQSHSINLADSETLQRQLDTRFIQLNAAADLELWQEAFRSVEDIYNLMNMSKKTAKPPFMMANYFGKLSKIFLVGDNYLFHAAALNKYFAIARVHKNMSKEEFEKYASRPLHFLPLRSALNSKQSNHHSSPSIRTASLVILSSLAIPIISYSRTDPDEHKPKIQRLTNLVKMTKAPSRDALLRDAISKSLLPRASKEIAQLYDALENKFHPLQICKKIEPIMKLLADHEDYSKYIKPLREVIVTRVLQQVCHIGDFLMSLCAKLSKFPNLSSLKSTLQSNFHLSWPSVASRNPLGSLLTRLKSSL